MSLGFLRSQDRLLSLVWQSIADARPLVPEGAPRMLSDCAQRLSQYGWKFQALVDSGFKWFEKCVDIDVGFDYTKFGLIVLTPLRCNGTPAAETAFLTTDHGAQRDERNS